MADTSVSVLLMCNKNWPHICYWDGHSSSAVSLDNSPANVFSVCMYQNTLIAAVDGSNTLHWTEPTDITAWPDVNQVDIEPQWGHVTNLVGLDDRVIVFCEKGILYLTGDLQSLPVVGVLHPEIGAARDMVSQYGTSMAFGFNKNLYIYDGSINIITDPIRDQFNFTPGSSVAISEKKVASRFSKAAGETSDAFILDKAHFGGWARAVFPTSTGVGQGNPTQAIVRYISAPWDCLMFPGVDGNLYIQPFLEQTDYIGKHDAAIKDYDPAIPITSTVLTHTVDFGDRVLTKQFRKGTIYGEGTNIVVNLVFTDKNKNVTTVTPSLTSNTLPCQFTLPVLDGTEASPPTEFNEFAIQITGTAIRVQAIYIDYRPTRYNLISFD
jgi:hypothetical protein